MKESKEFLRQQAIAEELRKQKAERSLKHTTSTTFKKGQPAMPGCGRKKGSKNSPRRKVLKEMKNRLQEVLATLIVSIEDQDFNQLSLHEKLKVLPPLLKFYMAEQQNVKVTETQIKKIEVSFADAFPNQETIDITPIEETKLLDETNLSDETGEHD